MDVSACSENMLKGGDILKMGPEEIIMLNNELVLLSILAFTKATLPGKGYSFETPFMFNVNKF